MHLYYYNKQFCFPSQSLIGIHFKSSGTVAQINLSLLFQNYFKLLTTGT